MNIIAAQFPQDTKTVKNLWYGYRDFLSQNDLYNFGGETIDPELTDLQSHYPEEEGGVYLAIQKEKPVGTIALNKIESKIAEARRLFVEPSYQGQGIARTLMEYVIKRAREKQYDTLLLDTFRSCPGPQKLYKSLGFHEREPYNNYPREQVMFMEIKL